MRLRIKKISRAEMRTKLLIVVDRYARLADASTLLLKQAARDAPPSETRLFPTVSAHGIIALNIELPYDRRTSGRTDVRGTPRPDILPPAPTPAPRNYHCGSPRLGLMFSHQARAWC